MPVKLSNIAANSAVLKVPVGESEEVTVEYYPGRISDEMFLTILFFQQELRVDSPRKFMDDFNAALVEIIKAWDLVEDDGSTIIPVTLDNVKKVYFPFKTLVISSIIREISPEAMVPVSSAKK